MRHKRIWPLMTLFLIGLSLLFVGFCKRNDPGSSDYRELIDKTWFLEKIHSHRGETIQVDRTYSLLINADRSAELIVDCNHCWGTVLFGQGGSIRFSDGLGCTEVGCGPDSHDSDFYLAIDKVFHFKINKGELYLHFDNLNSYLKFRQLEI